jgi:1,4-alpha-glucan branching enzyme
MIKSRGPGGVVSVTFTLAAAVGASHAAIGGEWNNWSPDRDVMEPAEGGGFTHTVELEPGRTYRFRYLLDGHRWENDWAADSYVSNDCGSGPELLVQRPCPSSGTDGLLVPTGPERHLAGPPSSGSF